MTKRYCVEVSVERITPITVQADSNEEALEAARSNTGEAGDEYVGDIKIVSILCLEEGGSS